ncbi:MAG TPA: sialidase family protein, partial [Chthoniobacterales bacterium]|nr:sialidase family protein [Chthoniobacterales bacterium]
TAIYVNASHDGGFTWLPAHVLDESILPAGTVDWSWVVADPVRNATAYVGWMRAEFDLVSMSLTSMDMMMSRTTDNGLTWSSAIRIGDAPHGYFWSPTRLIALPDGALLNIFGENPACTYFDKANPCPPSVTRVFASRSEDQGNTWSTPVLLAVIPPNSIDEETARMGERDANPPALAPDGTVFFGWAETASDRSSRYMLTSSSDGGRTWQAPAPVLSSASPIMNANLAAGPKGKLGLLFYRFAEGRHADPAFVNVWLASATEPYHGRSWQETQVGGPFDPRTLPKAVDLGGYQGIVAIPNGFALAFTMSQPAAQFGASDIFFTKVISSRQ